MIIQKAMAKRPQDRYESMEELDAELSAYEPGGDTTLLSIPAGDSQAWMKATNTEMQRSGSLHKQVRTVALARPMILLFGVLGVFLGAGNLIMAITAIFRIVKGGGARANLEVGEAVLLVLLVVFTLLTPLIFLVRWLAKSVWGNSVMSVQLADRLRGPVLVGLSAYGFATLLVRLVESVLLRRAVGVAWPWWDVLLFVICAAAALGAFLVASAEKPKAA
jgi:serine/threonine-protein kinase